MQRTIFIIDDVNAATACVAFAEQLGLNVAPDTANGVFEGAYLTTNSKNYDVNWIKNDEFAIKKAKADDIEILPLLDHVELFIAVCTNQYASVLEEDEVTLEDDNAPSEAIINALFLKVKNQKKSPAKYYLAFRNDAWVATTVADGAYSNLMDAYRSIN